MKLINLTPYRLIYRDGDIELIFEPFDEKSNENFNIFEKQFVENAHIEINNNNVSVKIPVYDCVYLISKIPYSQDRYYLITEDMINLWIGAVDSGIRNIEDINKILVNFLSRPDFIVAEVKDTEISNEKIINRFYFSGKRVDYNGELFQ